MTETLKGVPGCWGEGIEGSPDVSFGKNTFGELLVVVKWSDWIIANYDAEDLPASTSFGDLRNRVTAWANETYAAFNKQSGEVK